MNKKKERYKNRRSKTKKRKPSKLTLEQIFDLEDKYGATIGHR